MPLDLSAELATLRRLNAHELRQRFAELFGEATHTSNRTWLIRRLAWRLQALADGDLSERARQRAAQLANDADLRLNPPRAQTPTAPLEPLPVAAPADRRLPPPGTLLTRLYKGRQLHVQVLTEGFAYDGRVYPSLSAVAKAITGSHTNGFLFFRLNNTKGQA
jgi:Protein of unknown function (DUF2924)